MDGLGEVSFDPLVIVLAAVLTLSLFGLPWRRRRRGSVSRETLRTKCIWFDWNHSFLAMALRRALVVGIGVGLVRGIWAWSPELWEADPWASVHHVMASVARR